MSEFKKYKLSDVILGRPGNGLYKSAEFQGKGNRWLKMNEVFGYDFIRNQPCERIFVNKKEEEKYGCMEGDILFCRTSLKIEGIGKCCYIDKIKDIPIYESNLFRIRPNKGIVNPKFLFYYFKSDIGRSKVQNIANQTAAASIKGSELYELDIEIPIDLSTQTRIAAILSSLDDKIELNRRTTQTLEQIAQTLFKKYFVDDIDSENLPKGWRWGKLGEMIELVYGKSLKEGDRKGGEYPVVGSSGIVGYHDSFIAEENGIVVGRKGNAGAVIWLHKKFFPIDTTFYVKDLFQASGMYYYYFLLGSIDLLGLNSDSAVPGLNRNEAHFQDIIIPERKKVMEFNKIVAPFFERINSNEKEIDYLTKLRDFLLYKLMSGEIELNITMKEFAE